MRLDLAEAPPLPLRSTAGEAAQENAMRRGSRKRVMGAAVFAMLILYLYLAGRVEKIVDAPTAALIESLHLNPICGAAKSTIEIARCTRAAQNVISERIPGKSCTTKGQSIEPLATLRRGYACCYGRARLMEMILTYYNIPSRRVSLYHTDNWGIFALLIPRVPSHAAVEVKTPNGWMGVDSNEPFILMDRSGMPRTYAEVNDPKIAASLVSAPAPKAFFQAPYVVVYGLYSRHGFFLGANLPGPEINFPDFFAYNFRGETG